MDRYTAAALGQNLSSAFSEIGQMFDPRLRAAAEQQRLTNEGLGLRNQGLGISNQYAPKVYDSQIAQNYASANSSNAAAGNYNASAAFTNARTEGLSNLNKLANSLSVPTTTYSTGAAVGGLDEMQDSWTNKGYTSTGKNLSPGVVAVNPKVHPHGTVFRDPNTGEVFIAADSHGNKDPNVVDIFQPGDTYKPQKTTRNFEIVGREKIPYGTTKEQLDAIRQKYAVQPQVAPLDMNQAAIYSAIANGGGNPSQLVDAFAKVKGMNATDELTARQSLTGQGKFAGQGEYFDPSMSDAYQNRGLENNRVIADNNARMNLVGDLLKPAGGARGVDGSMPDAIGPKTFNDMQKVNEEAQAASFKVFRVPLDDDGAPTEDPYAPTRRAWAQSYANAIRAGMSQIEAEAAANLHHFGTDQPEIISEDSWFGEPSLPEIKNTEPLQRPQQSQVFSAQNQEQLAPIVAAILGLPVQTPAISNSGAPVTGVDNSNQQPNNAGQKPSGQQTIRRYNPATGAIE